jgi:hypothetical protein
VHREVKENQQTANVAVRVPVAKSFEAGCSHSRSAGKGSYVGTIMIVTIDTMMIMVPTPQVVSVLPLRAA